MPKRRLPPLPAEYRILVAGETAVGKTSLIARYVRNEFPCRTHSHINADGSTIYTTVIDGDDCTLTFVDISSIHDIPQLKSSPSIPTACFLVFSITDQRSFTKLNAFQESIRLRFPEPSIPMPFLIIGNKIDLEADRAVSQESIDKLKFYGDNVVEISVKGNVGISDAVYTAIKHLQHEQYHRLEQLQPNTACTCQIA